MAVMTVNEVQVAQRTTLRIEVAEKLAQRVIDAHAARAAPDYVTLRLHSIPQRFMPAIRRADARLNDTVRGSRARPVRYPDGHVAVVGLIINVSIVPIDGVSGALAEAGPTLISPQDRLPFEGVMRLDLADADRMLADGTLEDVLVHEGLHALGLGTLWSMHGLVAMFGPNDPRFVGARALAEYRILTGNPAEMGVPVANTGGSGTAGGHFRESTFGNELATGYIDSPAPLSAMSIASLADLGYVVDRGAADPYVLPGARILSARTHAASTHLCGINRPIPQIAPPLDIAA